jgi:hypothetical protein
LVYAVPVEIRDIDLQCENVIHCIPIVLGARLGCTLYYTIFYKTGVPRKHPTNKLPAIRDLKPLAFRGASVYIVSVCGHEY